MIFGMIFGTPINFQQISKQKGEKRHAHLVGVLNFPQFPAQFPPTGKGTIPEIHINKLSPVLESYSANWKISSIDRSNRRAALNARGKLGSNFPFSMALTVWRDTCNSSANRAWVQSRSARRTFSRFFTGISCGQLSFLQEM